MNQFKKTVMPRTEGTPMIKKLRRCYIGIRGVQTATFGKCWLKGKAWDLESNVNFYDSLDVWPCTGYLTSLSLSLLIC